MLKTEWESKIAELYLLQMKKVMRRKQAEGIGYVHAAMQAYSEVYDKEGK